MCRTDEILSNVVWLVEAIDEQRLPEIEDIPFLEMAKSVHIVRPPQQSYLDRLLYAGRYEQHAGSEPTCD
jgi:hypothetical protein